MKHKISPIPKYYIFTIDNKKKVKNILRKMKLLYPQYQKINNNYGYNY